MLAAHACAEGTPLQEMWPAVADALIPVLDAAASSKRLETIETSTPLLHLSVSAVALALPDGPRDRVLVLFTDLTERRELEQQLLQADKMDAIGRLAGGIAHDFNNLLTPIVGYTELVTASLAPDDERRKDLEEISNAARSAAALTQQLLAFSRKQVATRAPLALNDVLRRVDGIVRRTIGEDVRVVLDLAQDLDCTVLDRTQVEQIVMNLCVNARDAMPDGGTLTISTSNLTLARAQPGARGTIPAGRYVTLAVADTGSGIEPDVEAHIFDPFFTTKGPGQGTGLGLSIVYGIVKQSSGYISLDTARGAGTRFTLFFPRADVECPPACAGNTRAASAVTHDETVLVVEDHDGLRRLVDRVLRAEGYRTLLAQNAGEAIEIAQRFDGPIHLLLTDIVMPDVDGAMLARQFAGDRPDASILFMSGYTAIETGRHDLLTHGAPLLQKPFTRDSLRDAVHGALERTRARLVL